MTDTRELPPLPEPDDSYVIAGPDKFNAEQMRAYAADAIAALKAELAAERAKGMHSCQDNCTRSGCVNARLRAEVERLRVNDRRYRAVRLAGTMHNERRPFWEFRITDISGQCGPLPERLDADADMLADEIDAATKEQTP